MGHRKTRFKKLFSNIKLNIRSNIKPNIQLLDWLSLGLISFVSLLLILNPIGFSQDDWYHIKIAEVILERSSIPTWNYWEYAPVGRPHLYPPLLPLVIAGISLITSDVFIASMLVKTITYPLMLFGFWYVARKLAGGLVGFVTLIGILSVLPLLFMSAVLMPASLVLAISPFVLYFFLKKKFILTVALLSASMWLHVLMPVILIAGLFVFSFLNQKTYMNFFMKVFLLSSLIYSPWIFRLLLYRNSLSAIPTPSYITLPLLIWAVSIPGIFLSIKDKDKRENLIFVCYLAGLTMLLPFYGHRFWPYSILPIAFFAGVTIDKMTKSNRSEVKYAGVSLIFIIAFTSFIVSPGIYQGHDMIEPTFTASQTAFSWLTGMSVKPAPFGIIDYRIYQRNTWLEEASTWLADNTDSGETIALIGIYGTDASLVGVLAERNVTSGAWRENLDEATIKKIYEFIENDAEAFLIYFPAKPPSGGLIDIQLSQPAFGSLRVKVEKSFGPYIVAKRYREPASEEPLSDNTQKIVYIYYLL